MAHLPEQIRVHVVDYGRRNLYMRYVNPITHKQVMWSTGCPRGRKKDAARVALEWDSVLDSTLRSSTTGQAHTPRSSILCSHDSKR